jgi:Fe-S oxidoreductase
MKLTQTLKDIQGAASLCIKCAGCTYAEWPDTYTLCPLYARDECFTFSGGGLLYLIKALADKHIAFSQQVAELLATCTSCGACDSRCGIIRSQAPFVNPLDIIRLARRDAMKAGFVPAGLAQKNFRQINQSGDFGTKESGDIGARSSFSLSPKIKSEKADAMIFAECFHTQSQKQIAAATGRMLEKIGEPVSTFSEKGCCGSTLYDFGFWDELKPLVEEQWAAMKKKSAKTFIFLNPHCQEFIRKRYPEILTDYRKIKDQHISQRLAVAFKEGKLKSKQDKKIKVS